MCPHPLPTQAYLLQWAEWCPQLQLHRHQCLNIKKQALISNTFLNSEIHLLCNPSFLLISTNMVSQNYSPKPSLIIL